ncbi:MAG: hypothetical protein H7831_11600 [Magnetococcus sp. WYHC-3]
MSLEVAVIIGLDDQILFLQQGSNAVHIPDSFDLWDYIWKNKDNIKGVAHSHPGTGRPQPSYEDLTTFSAVELALGKRLNWWITSMTYLFKFVWIGPDKYDYLGEIVEKNPFWLSILKNRSYIIECETKSKVAVER